MTNDASSPRALSMPVVHAKHTACPQSKEVGRVISSPQTSQMPNVTSAQNRASASMSRPMTSCTRFMSPRDISRHWRARCCDPSLLPRSAMRAHNLSRASPRGVQVWSCRPRQMACTFERQPQSPSDCIQTAPKSLGSAGTRCTLIALQCTSLLTAVGLKAASARGCVARRRAAVSPHGAKSVHSTANLDKVAPPVGTLRFCPPVLPLQNIYFCARQRGEGRGGLRGDCLCSRSAPDLLVAEVQQ